MTATEQLNHDKELFTTGDISTLCNVAPRTVSKWIDDGHLPGFRIPGSNDRRVYRDELVIFLVKMGNLRLAERIKHGSTRMRVLVLATEVNYYDAIAKGMPEFSMRYAHVVVEAGAIVQESEPHVVLIDFSVGKADATMVSCWLSRRHSPPLTVGLIPEDWHMRLVEPLREHGFADFLKKPVDPILLHVWLESHNPFPPSKSD